MMIDLLLTFESPTLKYIEMYVWIYVGIGSSCNSPAIFTISPLFILQVSQDSTRSSIYIVIMSHKNKILFLS
jgi:hypothetical protein